MIKASIALALLVACNGDGSGTSSGGKGGDALGKDWSGVAIDTTTTANIGNIMFDIQMPSGWKEDKASATIISRAWRPDMQNHGGEPLLTVLKELKPPTTMDEFVREVALDDKYVIEHKEMNGDFFIIAAHTKDNYTVRVVLVRQKGDTNLACQATQNRVGGVPNPQATQAWLEKLCQSLKIK
jgi:hypothetical protein